MITIPIETSSGRYRVLVGRGSLAAVGALLGEAGLSGNVRLVADETVYRLYGPVVESSLRAAGYSVGVLQVPPGERSKSLESAARIYDWLVDSGTERRDLVVALGGGVIGDLAGFVAATFLRGLRVVQVPTTLLAQVDSSVGGKVAINHPRGKNLIGAFYPPSLVVADPATLSSLPPVELSAALAEIAKMGMIMDAKLFEKLEQQGEQLLQPENEALEGVIGRTIELKASVVEQDERETGLRETLNYGHTIGHGVETVTGYSSYRHGEAVAIGMAGAARVAVRLGMLDTASVQRQADLLARFNLPARCAGLSVDSLLEAMSRDKKASQGHLTWVLPEGIGLVTVRKDVPVDVVRQVLGELTR